MAGEFPNCTVKVLCEGQFEANGGAPPYTWSVQAGETLPPGLTLKSDGAFTGIPTQYDYFPGVEPFGNYTLSVQVTDSSTPPLITTDNSVLRILSGLSIVSIPLPVATVRITYQAPPPVATGGLPPYTWTIQGPEPEIDEYVVDPKIGAIRSVAGGPITSGFLSLVYTVTDSEGHPSAFVKMNAVLNVLPAPVSSMTTLSSSNSTAGAGMPVTLTALVTATEGTPAGAGVLTGCGASSHDARAGTYNIPITLTVAGETTQTVSATVIVQ